MPETYVTSRDPKDMTRVELLEEIEAARNRIGLTLEHAGGPEYYEAWRESDRWTELERSIRCEIADELEQEKAGTRKRPSKLHPLEKGARAYVRRWYLKRERGEKAAERAAQKEQERQEKIRAAAGETIQLPAIQLRGADPMHISPEDACTFLFSSANRGETIGLDVETTGYPVGHAHYALRTIQLGSANFAIVLDASDPTQRQIASVVLKSAHTLTAHNAAADIVPVAVAGLADGDELWEKMLDTATMAKLADPNLTGDDPGLKELGPNLLGADSLVKATDTARKTLFTAGKWLTNTEIHTDPERSGWYQVPSDSDTMIRYAATDVLEGSAILRALPRQTEHVEQRERDFQRFCGKISEVGVRLDSKVVEAQIAEREPVIEQMASELAEYGIENPGSSTKVRDTLINIGAKLPDGKSGNPSADKKALKDLLTQHESGDIYEVASRMLRWRKESKLLSATLYPFRALIQEGDGRARPTIYTLGADTGRTSCVRPNLQQVPKSGGLRECFIADPGYVILACDFSQVEVRVGAALSGDENLKYLIVNGLDLHKTIANLVFGEGNWGDVDKVRIKIINFTKMFGGSVKAMARGAGVSVSMAQRVSDKFDEFAPSYAEWCKKMMRQVQMGKTQFETYSGRIIHLPPDFPHKAQNYPVQGTARELAVDTALALQQRPDLFPSWRLIVHDEWVAQVPEEKAEEAGKYLLDSMTTEFMGVPITAELDPPTRAWQSAK